MRARIVLLLSLVFNLVLAGMIVFLSRENEELLSEPVYARDLNDGSLSNRVRTHVVVRRQPITWPEIESADYREYIANLRRLGCPEKTIRDIIVADVEELFASRLSKELVLPDQKWWEADPDLDAIQAAADQIRALEAEKRQLLTELLGPGWDATPAQRSGEIVRLDGPVLSKLPDEVKQEVQRIVAQAVKAEELAASSGEPAAEALARIRRETRAGLARVLSPEQLEEYLLRYSHTAEELRQNLRGFDAGPGEFRSIFRALDTYDQQIAAVQGEDAAAAQRRAELTRMRDEAVRQELGEKRFVHYQLSTNPLFQQAQQEAQRVGAPAESVLPIFEINRLAQQEIQRIERDNSLSDQERLSALRLVQDQQQDSIRRVIQGELAPEPPLPQ